jgi:hypothetical protein
MVCSYRVLVTDFPIRNFLTNQTAEFKYLVDISSKHGSQSIQDKYGEVQDPNPRRI